MLRTALTSPLWLGSLLLFSSLWHGEPWLRVVQYYNIPSSNSAVSTAFPGRWTYLTTLPRMNTFLTDDCKYSQHIHHPVVAQFFRRKAYDWPDADISSPLLLGYHRAWCWDTGRLILKCLESECRSWAQRWLRGQPMFWRSYAQNWLAYYYKRT